MVFDLYIFRMQIELSVFGTGLGIIIDKIHAEFNEVWLAEAMKSAWSVWAELGWKCNKNMKVQTEDWNSFNGDEVKLEIIDKITRFNRVSRRLSFNLKSEWVQGWRLILDVAEIVKRYDVRLDANDETYHFRLMTVKFMAMGILKGINDTNADISEEFIYETRDILGNIPFEYKRDSLL